MTTKRCILAILPVSTTTQFIITMLFEKWSKKSGMVGKDLARRRDQEDIIQQSMKIPMMQKVSCYFEQK